MDKSLGLLIGIGVLIIGLGAIYLVGYTIYSFIMFVISTIPMWVLILFGIIAIVVIAILIYYIFFEDE